MSEEVNWEKQAQQFLELHGWKKDDSGFTGNAWEHPCYPLMEQFEPNHTMLMFVEQFYGEAWKAHKATIDAIKILEPKQKCDHRNELGSLTYEVEDQRCDTDRGTFGSIVYFCNRCDEDITELVESERESEQADNWRKDE